MRIKVNPDGSYLVSGSVNQAEIDAAVKAAKSGRAKADPKPKESAKEPEPEAVVEPELPLLDKPKGVVKPSSTANPSV